MIACFGIEKAAQQADVWRMHEIEGCSLVDRELAFVRMHIGTE
jgi:hypothetical protein